MSETSSIRKIFVCNLKMNKHFFIIKILMHSTLHNFNNYFGCDFLPNAKTFCTVNAHSNRNKKM